MKLPDLIDTIAKLRMVSEGMESSKGDIIIFPPFEEEDIKHLSDKYKQREQGIVEAAKAIANGEEDGVNVSIQNLGYLVRYVADMMDCFREFEERGQQL